MNKLLVAFAVPMIAACTGTTTRDPIRTQPITNELGYVIGRTDVMKDASTGEKVVSTTYYTPRYDPSGKLIAYEESVPGGVVIRALSGRRIGVRYSDLRSRGSNPNNDGITVVVPGPAMRP